MKKPPRFVIVVEMNVVLDPEAVDAVDPAEIVAATFFRDLEDYLNRNGWAFRLRGGLRDEQCDPDRPSTDLAQLIPDLPAAQVPLADPERNLH